MNCRRTVVPLAASAALILTALSIRSAALLAIGLLLLLMPLYAILSVSLAAKKLSLSLNSGTQHVIRGEDFSLGVKVSSPVVLPVAPAEATVSGLPGEAEKTLMIPLRVGRTSGYQDQVHAAHVGVCRSGLDKLVIRDLFGLVEKTVVPEDNTGEVLVLPRTFAVETMPLAVAESVTESVARATEDVNNPSDIRAYQPGDSLKKIHWKLSARKHELLVRRFEEPVRADTLVLADCSEMPSDEHLRKLSLLVQDCILETTASVMEQEIRDDHVPHLPLNGRHPFECDGTMGMARIRDQLARVDFSQTERFYGVLELEMRRMRRVGAVIAITAKLNSRAVEALMHMRKSGPYVRLYYVTFDPDAPEARRYIGRLQRKGIEVRLVEPQAV